MSGAPGTRLRERLARVRAGLASAGLDALVVSHPPNLRYLTGFAGTAGSAILTATRAILIVDSRYATEATALAERTGGRLFDVAVARTSGDEDLAAMLRELACRRIGVEAESMPVGRFNRLGAALAPRAGLQPGMVSGHPMLLPTERAVENARIVKDASEIAILREAARRLSDVGRQLRQFVAPGRTEREVAADIDAALRRAGFERPAFDTIAASGPNSALPHARPGSRVLEEGDGVVLDFGGVYDGYCVDLTRTLQIGPGSAEFRRIFAAVARAHSAAVAAVMPGVRTCEIDTVARAVLDRHGLGAAFAHGTGHGLGLEVHEEPRLTRAGAPNSDTVVQPGMVFTIEPGAYLPGVGGVRIEDDVLVVDGGVDVLTDVPIEL